MRILPISILLLLAFGCASYPEKEGFTPLDTTGTNLRNPYFSDASKDYVYEADIKAFDNSFSGIAIIKKLGVAHHRVVFTTKMGNTLFDFSFQGDALKVNRILNDLNRKILINILHRDFKALITEHPPVTKTFLKANDTLWETHILSKKHYFYASKGRLRKIVRSKSGKEKVILTFSGIRDGKADEITIDHKSIPLNIRLSSL